MDAIQSSNNRDDSRNDVVTMDSGEQTLNFNPWSTSDKDATAIPKSSSRRRNAAVGQAAELDDLVVSQSTNSSLAQLLDVSNGLNSQRENRLVEKRGATPSAFLSDRGSNFEQLVSADASPLMAGLSVGLSGLQKKVLTFFVIAYGHEGTQSVIRDPGLDTQYLKELFGRLPGVYFSSLLGSHATLSQINDELISLWSDAVQGTHLLLLLTGHGVNNEMVLYNNERVDESCLANLIKSLPPKDIHVTVIFDICRDNRDKAAARMDDRVALIWSCSPGQRASALEFEQVRMPSSFLLIGLFMASWDARKTPDNTFEYYLNLRVTQLARFDNHIRHRTGCKTCLDGQTCSQAFVMRDELAQDIDLDQARGALNKLHLLFTQWPDFTRLSDGICTFMMNNEPFLRSNNLPLAPRSPKGSALQQSRGLARL